MENRLNARITEVEERLGSRMTALENNMNARMTALESRLDAGLAELRAAHERTNSRIDKQFYTLVGIGGALLVGMAAILIRSFL